jgi:hypothetical protein
VGGRKLGGVEHETPVEFAVAVEAALAARAFEDLIGPAGAVVQLHCHAYHPEDGPRRTRNRSFPPVTLRADQVREVHAVGPRDGWAAVGDLLLDQFGDAYGFWPVVVVDVISLSISAADSPTSYRSRT